MHVDLWAIFGIAAANAFSALMAFLSHRQAAKAAVAAEAARVLSEQIKKQTDGLTTALVAKTAIIAKAEGKAEGIAEANGH